MPDLPDFPDNPDDLSPADLLKYARQLRAQVDPLNNMGPGFGNPRALQSLLLRKTDVPTPGSVPSTPPPQGGAQPETTVPPSSGDNATSASSSGQPAYPTMPQNPWTGPIQQITGMQPPPVPQLTPPPQTPQMSPWAAAAQFVGMMLNPYAGSYMRGYQSAEDRQRAEMWNQWRATHANEIAKAEAERQQYEDKITQLKNVGVLQENSQTWEQQQRDYLRNRYETIVTDDLRAGRDPKAALDAAAAQGLDANAILQNARKDAASDVQKRAVLDPVTGEPMKDAQGNIIYSYMTDREYSDMVTNARKTRIKAAQEHYTSVVAEVIHNGGDPTPYLDQAARDGLDAGSILSAAREREKKYTPNIQSGYTINGRRYTSTTQIDEAYAAGVLSASDIRAVIPGWTPPEQRSATGRLPRQPMPRQPGTGGVSASTAEARLQSGYRSLLARGEWDGKSWDPSGRFPMGLKKNSQGRYVTADGTVTDRAHAARVPINLEGDPTWRSEVQRYLSESTKAGLPLVVAQYKIYRLDPNYLPGKQAIIGRDSQTGHDIVRDPSSGRTYDGATGEEVQVQ